MKKRLLYTAFDVVPAPKGASVRIQKMLEALGQEFDVLALVLGEPGMPDEESWGTVRVRRLIAPESHFLEKTVQFAEWVLQTALEWQPEWIQFRSLWDGFVLSEFRRQNPVKWQLIYEVHGLPEIELEHHFPELPESLGFKIQAQQQQVLESADWFICPSQVHRKWLLSKGICDQKMGVIGNGADPELFLPHWQEWPEVPYLIYLGTLAPWQGLEELLAALQKVKPPFRLRLVGKGNPRWQQNLLARVYQLGLTHAVELLDPLAHAYMPALLESAQIALAPLIETERNCVQGCNPIKIYEYMAAGKAIIAPDLPAVQEILEHQKTAWLYPAGDQAALTAAIETLLKDPLLSRRLGQAARDDVVKSFNWAQRQNQLLSYFRKVISV